ncbi:uncharacterized protein KY384_007021 [Bacidia gigantensis]|uniref:uncharacterized protein n=1 Tax=Bacidia gigantensis TaxID=2732470 RepID=UPI001D036C3E|nr:uncharacterized protein KY384_007021 [Bacidia gigantensis]KAG8528105.1 hypothetical protein KY384_007021 [Bacidia gigantensis]
MNQGASSRNAAVLKFLRQIVPPTRNVENRRGWQAVLSVNRTVSHLGSLTHGVPTGWSYQQYEVTDTIQLGVCEMLSLLWICCSYGLVTTAPTVHLPLNAQVPSLARAGQHYSFGFSNSTCVPSTGSVNYQLSDPPPWLALNDQTCMLFGTPAEKDVGSFLISLVAADPTGSIIMPFTLVVTEEMGPNVGLSIADQLPAFGAFSSPSSILLAPLTSLSITLSQSTFTNTDESTAYYAISVDRTPLPSWIHFDPPSLSFSGTAPQATSGQDVTQTFGVLLIASNCIGFADAVLNFDIVVENHLLAFRSYAQVLNVIAGLQIATKSIIQSLMLDGRALDPSDIKQVYADTPSWLSLDHSSLELEGIPPPDFKTRNCTITVTDQYGDSASTIVTLQLRKSTDSTLLDPIGSVNATQGVDFVYDINRMIIFSDVDINVDLGLASTWLKFDRQSLKIIGFVPPTLEPQQVVVNITADHGDQSQSEILAIAVQSASSELKPGLVPMPSSTHVIVNNAHPSSAVSASKVPLERRFIPAIIVPSMFLLAMCPMALCWRKRSKRKQQSSIEAYKTASNQSPSPISMVEKISQAPKPAGMSGGIGAKKESRISLPHRISHISLFESIASHKRVSKGQISKPKEDDWYQRLNIKPSRIESSPSEIVKDCTGGDQTQTAAQACAVPTVGAQQTILRAERSFEALKASGFFNTTLVKGVGHGKPTPSTSSLDTPSRTRSQCLIEDLLTPANMGSGLVRKSWKTLEEKARSSGLYASTTGSSNQAPYLAQDPTIRHVPPSSSASGTSPRTPPGTGATRLDIPKSRRKRQSKNPFLLSSARSIHSHRFRGSRSRSSSLHPPEIPTLSKAEESQGRTPRYLETKVEPRVTNVQEGYPESVFEKSSRFESPMSSQHFDHRSANKLTEKDVQAGLSPSDQGYKRQRDTMTAWASSLALEFEDDNFMEGDVRTTGPEDEKPTDIRGN